MGLNPNTLRSWKLRYDKDGLENQVRALVSGPRPEGYSGSAEQWQGMTWEQRTACANGLVRKAAAEKETTKLTATFEAKQTVNPAGSVEEWLKAWLQSHSGNKGTRLQAMRTGKKTRQFEHIDIDHAATSLGVKRVREGSGDELWTLPTAQEQEVSSAARLKANLKAAEKKELRNHFAKLPNLGSVQNSGEHVYGVGLYDFKFYVRADRAETLRTRIKDDFRDKYVDIFGEVIVTRISEYKDACYGTKTDIVWLHKITTDELRTASEYCEDAKKALKQTLSVRESIRKEVSKNISGVQTEQLKKSIAALDDAAKALKEAKKCLDKVTLPKLQIVI